eukprot:scaffold3800_cov87-Skeletonema_dohrnii-CCMP3373.AAC.7
MQQRQMYKPSPAWRSVLEAWGKSHSISTATAFGSEFEMTYATQTLLNQCASRDCLKREGPGGSSVPGELTIPTLSKKS